MEMEIEIPVGSEAEVVLPEEVKIISINGLEYQRATHRERPVQIQSGRYKVAYKVNL
jgi:hypothetical protein